MVFISKLHKLLSSCISANTFFMMGVAGFLASLTFPQRCHFPNPNPTLS